MGWITIGLDGYFEGRLNRKRRKVFGRLQSTCVHIADMEYDEADDSLSIKFQFESPVGTLDYTCQGCGMRASKNTVRLHSQRIEGMCRNDPLGTLRLINERADDASKLRDKLNRIGGRPD